MRVMPDEGLKAEYAQPHHLVKIYNIGRTTVWRYLTEMRARKEYSGDIVKLSHNMTIVRVSAFEKYLRSIKA